MGINPNTAALWPPVAGGLQSPFAVAAQPSLFLLLQTVSFPTQTGPVASTELSHSGQH